MHKQFIFLGLILATIVSFSAQAQIYKYVDSEGRVTYSNVKTKGAKKLELEPADTNFGNDESPSRRANSTKTATPPNFPKVDTDTQKQRDTSRKEILQSELDAEKAALAEAKKAYAEGEADPETFKTKGGKTLRNVTKFQEKMKDLQADVDAHQRNVDLLEKEISTIN